jgi:hypothetical protein
LFFHVDFDNLSNAELTLLLAALKPSDGFLHRLGLGKSLGLGSVDVRIEGVFFIDRWKRYGRTALQELRYHSVWRPSEFPSEIDWRSNYPEEAEHVGKCLSRPREDFHDESSIDGNTRKLVETVGDQERYMKETIEVHTPLLDEQLNSPENKEKETFKWFVANDDGGAQALPPIRAHQPLQPLCTQRPRQELNEPHRNPPRGRTRR